MLDEAEVDTEQDESEIGGINITPLVDVALTLVLIFMVAMPLSAVHGITVRRQLLQRYGLTTPQESVLVRLTGKGVFVQDKRGKDKKIAEQDFAAVLSQMIRNSSGKHLLLQCDRAVPHGQVVRVMDISKQNGAADISLIGG